MDLYQHTILLTKRKYIIVNIHTPIYHSKRKILRFILVIPTDRGKNNVCAHFVFKNIILIRIIIKILNLLVCISNDVFGI